MTQDVTNEELKGRVRDSGIWARLLYIVLFALIYSAAEVVLGVVVFFQFLCVLLTGEKNARVLALGAQLSSFVYQVFRYLTFNSDERPFPFADWPSDAELTVRQAAASPAPRRAPRAKRAASTATAKRGTAKKPVEPKTDTPD